MEKSITAKLKYVHVPPRKARFVADVIRGLSVNEAEAKLMLSPRRPSLEILKLLRSAVANADHNFKIEAGKLFVKEIRVDQGTKSKRWMPRARGSVSPLERKTSHVTLVLETSDRLKAPRFAMPEKPKKKEKLSHKEKMAIKEKGGGEREPRPEKKTIERGSRPTKPGFFKRVFRRKSI